MVMVKRSGKSFWIALASFTLITLILAGFVEELIILDQPLISLIDQIISEESETYGGTYEEEDFNISGGYGGSGTSAPSGYGGSTVADWGRVLIVEDTVPSESIKTISVDDYLTIVFPRGSVKGTSVIKVYRVENPTPIAGEWQPLLVYDVELSSKLETSVTLELRLDQVPENVDLTEVVSFAEYIQEYNTWVLIPTRIEDGKLVATVNHFSVKGVLIYAQKAVSFISNVLKGMGSKAADAYENARGWIQSNCIETPNFRVCYTNATLTFNNMGQLKTVNTSTVATRLGYALEIARDRYIKAGFKVPREKKNVYIVVGQEKNQYSIIWGNIYVQNAPTEEEMVLSAFHELFHAVQDEYLALIYHMTVARTNWFIEASADYAAYRIAAERDIGSEITFEYFGKPFTYTDGVHEYSTAHLLDYAIRRAEFPNLWLNTCKSPSSKEAYANVFMSYASKLNGRPFTDIYYGFARHMLFNESSKSYKSGYLLDSMIPVVETLPLSGNLTKEVTLESFTAKLILVKIEYDSSRNSNRTLSISTSSSDDGDIRVGVFTASTKQGSLSGERVQLSLYRERGVLSGKNDLKVRVNRGERLILLALAAPSEYKEKKFRIKISVMDAVNVYQFGYSYREKIDSSPPTDFKLKVNGSIQGLPDNAVAVFQSEGVKEGNIYSNPPVVNVGIKDFKNPIILKITLYVETNLKKGTTISFKTSRPEIDYVKVCTMEFSDPEYFICTGRYETSCTIKLNAAGSPATLTYDYRLDPPLNSNKTLIFTISWRLRQTCEETQFGEKKSWEEKGTEYIAILIVYLHRGN